MRERTYRERIYMALSVVLARHAEGGSDVVGVQRQGEGVRKGGPDTLSLSSG